MKRLNKELNIQNPNTLLFYGELSNRNPFLHAQVCEQEHLFACLYRPFTKSFRLCTIMDVLNEWIYILRIPECLYDIMIYF